MNFLSSGGLWELRFWEVASPLSPWAQESAFSLLLRIQKVTLGGSPHLPQSVPLHVQFRQKHPPGLAGCLGDPWPEPLPERQGLQLFPRTAPQGSAGTLLGPLPGRAGEASWRGRSPPEPQPQPGLAGAILAARGSSAGRSTGPGSPGGLASCWGPRGRGGAGAGRGGVRGRPPALRLASSGGRRGAVRHSRLA